MLKAALAASFKLLLFLEPAIDGSLELAKLCDVEGRSRAAVISYGPPVLRGMASRRAPKEPSNVLGDAGMFSTDGAAPVPEAEYGKDLNAK
jgi:hypothetical protein